LHTNHDSRTADVEHRVPANRGRALRSAPVARLLAVGAPLVAASAFALTTGLNTLAAFHALAIKFPDEADG
jgi:hypothetical protein